MASDYGLDGESDSVSPDFSLSLQGQEMLPMSLSDPHDQHVQESPTYVNHQACLREPSSLSSSKGM